MEHNSSDAKSDWIFVPQIDYNSTGMRAVEVTPAWYTVFYVTVCSLISVITIVANIGVFGIVLSKRHLRTATNSLLLSLATADLIAGAVMIPFYIDIKMTSNSNRIKCLIRKFLFLLTSSASITSLCAVSIDRMIAISYPYLYARKATESLAKLVILIVWILCLTLSSLSFVRWKEWDSILNNCAVGIPTPLYLIVTPPAFYLSGVLILVAYIKIYMIARKHRLQIQVANETSTRSPSVVERPCNLNENYESERRRSKSISVAMPKWSKKAKRSLIRDLKAAKTVSILVGVFLVCWSPTAIFYIYVNSKHLHKIHTSPYLYISEGLQILSFMNSFLDPILYSFLNREIRTHIKKVIKVMRTPKN